MEQLYRLTNICDRQSGGMLPPELLTKAAGFFDEALKPQADAAPVDFEGCHAEVRSWCGRNRVSVDGTGSRHGGAELGGPARRSLGASPRRDRVIYAKKCFSLSQLDQHASNISARSIERARFQHFH